MEEWESDARIKEPIFNFVDLGDTGKGRTLEEIQWDYNACMELRGRQNQCIVYLIVVQSIQGDSKYTWRVLQGINWSKK